MDDLEKMVSISIETTGRVGSACLGRGDRLLEEISLSGKMRHSSELLPAIQTILGRHGLKSSDVGYFYFPAGPGSFTGLRIAVTMAKMLAYALPVKLVAVNSLDVIAQNASEYIEQTGEPIERVASILDAKKNLFYAAVYQRADVGWSPVEGNLLVSAEELVGRFAEASESQLHLLGEGLHYYRDKFAHERVTVLPDRFWAACARNVFRLGRRKTLAGEFTNPDTLTPLYIRRPEAVEKWESRSSQ